MVTQQKMFRIKKRIPFLQDLISQFRTDYTPPTRKVLAGDLLDKVSDELNLGAKNMLKETIVMSVDGWSRGRVASRIHPIIFPL